LLYFIILLLYIFIILVLSVYNHILVTFNILFCYFLFILLLYHNEWIYFICGQCLGRLITSILYVYMV
jgi:hypothetical protein